MNDDELRDALGAIADPGPLDEDAAWRSVQARAAAGRRRKAVVVGSGVLVAGAAAALAVLAATGDPVAVDTVPPATEVPAETTATTTTTPPAVTGPTLVAASLDGTRILAVDPVTGATTDLATVPEGGIVRDLELAPDGVVYVELGLEPGSAVYDELDLPDTSADAGRVVVVVGDGGTLTPVHDLDGATVPAVSPDGRLLAYVQVTDVVGSSSVHVVDRASGELVRSLGWAPGEEDFFLTQGSIMDLAFSPDGTQLLLNVAYEGSDIVVVDVDAGSLSEGTIVGGGMDDVEWLADGRIVGIDACCYPEHDRKAGIVEATLGEDPVVVEAVTPRGLAAGADGLWMQVDEGLALVCGPDTRCAAAGVQPDLGEPGPSGPRFAFDAR